MKDIFKKALKFVSSRLVYLVIGIFLAIGATYVYATWDQARTGDSGLLTEANWNELVTMVENNIGGEAERGTDDAALDSEVGDASDAASMSTTLFAGQQAIYDAAGGGVTYEGVTSTTYQGNLGGYTGANDKCNTKYAGSHICSRREIISSGRTTALSAGWIRCETRPYTAEAYAWLCDSLKLGYYNGYDDQNTECGDYTYSGIYGFGAAISNTGGSVEKRCDYYVPIHCCK